MAQLVQQPTLGFGSGHDLRVVKDNFLEKRTSFPGLRERAVHITSDSRLFHGTWLTFLDLDYDFAARAPLSKKRQISP